MTDSQIASIKSEAGFGALFENATVGILVIDSKGLIQLAIRLDCPTISLGIAGKAVNSRTIPATVQCSSRRSNIKV